MAQYSQRTQPMHSQNKWLKVIGRTDLLKKTNLKPLSYKICSVHFENSKMSEVLTRKLLPGAVPTKLLSNKSSTSVKGSKSSEQTKHSNKKELSVVKMKNASTMTMVHTQTVSVTNEGETQKSSPLSSGKKRKWITQLQNSEKNKRRLQHELDRTKKDTTDAKSSLSRYPSGKQSEKEDDDEVTERLFDVSVKVECSDVSYEPKLWYYKHLSFLSGDQDTDEDDSDSDSDDDTEEPLQDDPMSLIDASAAAFGRSVGAQLHHLSKMQRCIAEKIISDVIYHGKMEQLTLNTSINLKETVQDHDTILIPKAGPSWYDTVPENGEQESSSSRSIPIETEDLARREIEETQNAVNFIKMESADTETYVFHDDDVPDHTTIDLVKEEL